MYFVTPVPFSLSFFFCVFVFFFCSHWSLVDVPLIFFCPADHVPDWQPRVLLGMVEARSVNVKKTTTTTTIICQIQPEYGDEQADAGRDYRTRLARPNSHVQTGTGC